MSRQPAWTPCDCCNEHWCTIHQLHAFECPCPPVEDWVLDPYSSQPSSLPSPPMTSRPDLSPERLRRLSQELSDVADALSSRASDAALPADVASSGGAAPSSAHRDEPMQPVRPPAAIPREAPETLLTWGRRSLLGRGQELVSSSRDDQEARIYTTQAGGVWRIVAVIAQREGLGLLGGGLSVQVNGRTVWDDRGRWCLVPGQAWVRSWYVNGSAAQYWAARKPGLRVPAWAADKLRAYRRELERAALVGPFSPGLPWDPGNAPGADWGVATDSDESWLCPDGHALMALEMEQMAQRSRVFHMDAGGNPAWRPIEGGHWMSWTPDPLDAEQDRTAREWWPGYAKMVQIGDPDDQHAPRGWRSASILKDHDPFADWYLQHWRNRMELQWAQVNDDEHNSLLRGMSAVISRTSRGQGCESLGRAGLWAAYLAQQSGSILTAEFFDLLRLAAHHRTGEVMAVPRKWVPDQNTGVIGPEERVGLTHEMAISVAVRRKMGVGMAAADAQAGLLLDAPGKCKVFGEDRWELHPLPYVELQEGDFRNFGGSAETFLSVCASRSAMGSDQPLLSCPRRFWEGAL